MEDPTQVRTIGIELRLSADVGSLSLRGIIDRLDLRDDGELVVIDYKTGRAPSINWEQKSLAGVHFYSFLCEQVLGRRPAAIRLMYLSTRRDDRGHAVGAVGALHHHPHDRRVAGRRAGVPDRGLPAPSRARCATSCSFQQWCPAFGGDPELGPRRGPGACRPPAWSRRDRRVAGVDGLADARPARRPRQVSSRRPLGARSGDRPLRPLGRRALERLRGNPIADTVFVVGHQARRLQPDLAHRQRRPRPRPATGAPTRCRCWRSPSAPRACSSTRASSGCSAGRGRPPRVTPATRCAGR